VEDESALVVSVLREPHPDTGEHRALVRTKDKDLRVFFPALGKAKGNKKARATPRSAQLIKALQSVHPLEIEPREIVGCMEQYLDLEEQLHLNCHKFGVAHCVASEDGSAVTENSLYTSEPTPAYERFLELLGERVQLEGWSHYTAGLDVRHNSTGTHSMYTTLVG
jgi:Rap/ran-GAP